jgi:hypothetical protein
MFILQLFNRVYGHWDNLGPEFEYFEQAKAYALDEHSVSEDSYGSVWRIVLDDGWLCYPCNL